MFIKTSTNYYDIIILEIVNNINLLQKNGFRPGAILVVNNKNVKGLIDEYSLFNSMNVGLKLNPMFIDGAAAKNFV